MRALAATLAAALALAGAAAPAAAQQPRADLADIADEVMCPVCGTLLELAEAPQAQRQKELIRELIARGHTKEEIKQAMVAEFGPEVLAVPDDEGFDLVAWIAPGAGLVVAAIAIGAGLRRWRRETAAAGAASRAPAGASTGEGAAGASPTGSLSASERERLDEDLGRYEL